MRKIENSEKIEKTAKKLPIKQIDSGRYDQTEKSVVLRVIEKGNWK